MSSTKRTIPPYPIINSGSMAGNLLSSETNVLGMDYSLLVLEWDGTSPVGVVNVEVLKERRNNIEVWEAVDFGGVTGTDIPISGNTGSHQVLFNQLPFEKMRTRYTRTSGTGTLDAFITVKEG